LTRKNPTFKGLCVLVVDDDEDSLEVVRALLTHRGASVSTATSAANALRDYVARGCAEEVVVSDLSMPNRDGIWLVRQLKSYAAASGQHLWAIAFTGHAEDSVRREALEAGFDVFLTKPIDLDAFLAAVLRGRASSPTAG
jgi:two-component system, chemotaxis family, CheB/CheR fusion protein